MTKGKFLAVCLVWLFIFGVGATAWRFVVTPMRQSAAQEEEQQAKEAALLATEGELPYQHELNLALDGFSGYAVLRSPRFSQLLRQRQIKLNLSDDGANYAERLAGLKRGDTQMAAFTIDALIKTTATSGSFPATIVSLIDETAGADAMLAYKSSISNVDDLNHPDVRFVVVPDSPSETLARVVMSNFALDQLPTDPFVFASDADDIITRYKNSSKNTSQVFVIWEPMVSQILANDSMHVVIDSSRFTGYIVDCLVADRDFLVKQPEVARDVVECYFQALYEVRKPDEMRRLVSTDAGPSIDETTATKLVDGIRWKNTQDNFAHFGLRDADGVQHVADMIDNITSVLVQTGAIDSDPTDGQPNRLYFDKILRDLAENNFHPGDEIEQVAGVSELAELSEEQWTQLVPVGTLAVPDLVFPRGTDRLTATSESVLDELVQRLETWPQYYVSVNGDASRLGDLAANQKLAESRAIAARDYLVSHGISPRRIRAVGVPPSGVTRVNFVLGQLPY